MGTRIRQGLLPIGLAVLASLVAGCELDDTEAGSEQQIRSLADDGVAPADSRAPDEPTPLDPAAVQHVASCVEQTKARAFIGDEFWLTVWTDLGQNDMRLHGWCSDLAVADQATLADIHADWLEFSAAIDAAESNIPAPELPSPPLPAVDPGPAPQPEVAEPADTCHPSYDPCVPIGSDADCASGSGDGPIYVTQPVRIIGPDEYGLDGNDNDGLGCERE